ncbi:FkbM family methyltransferase [Nostoc sp.]|uniref:FkbM family methyltransferase n=1 Tax=Nostoc sp. TaxID=1180 RepID=UPI002FF7E02B
MVWAKLKANFYPSFNISHSQFGEDMLVRALTRDIKNGFYIEIGAHHPVYISNTYHFYCKGWKGINIDAIPGSMDIFNILRPRDINLEACIVPLNNSNKIKFFMFEQSAFNTCDPDMAQQALSKGNKFLKEVMLPGFTITEILDSYLPKQTKIDFMSIDVEGLDEQILMSNDWERYQPKIIIFEKHLTKEQEFTKIPIIEYLASFGYELVGKLGFSLILMREIE